MIGIDLLAVAVFAVAFVVAQLRTLPVRFRYGVLSTGCGIIAISRLRGGGHRMNLVFAAIAVALALYYAVKAMRSVPR